MGTDSDYRSNSTAFETQLSEKMQDLWLAFAQNPKTGLPNIGWSPYSAKGSAFVFGLNGILVQKEGITVLDAACPAT
jgi:acetylcholinesterase